VDECEGAAALVPYDWAPIIPKRVVAMGEALVEQSKKGAVCMALGTALYAV
jgi:hypothetical protein